VLGNAGIEPRSVAKVSIHVSNNTKNDRNILFMCDERDATQGLQFLNRKDFLFFIKKKILFQC
jgi:hypothetical protein